MGIGELGRNKLHAMLVNLSELMSPYSLAVGFYHPDQQFIKFELAVVNNEYFNEEISIPTNSENDILLELMEQRKSIFVTDALQRPCALRNFTRIGISSELYLPLLEEDKFVGVLVLGWLESLSSVSATDLRTGQCVAQQMESFHRESSLIQEVKSLETKIVRLRNFYSTLARVNAALTRVQNKQALFEEVCQVAVRFGGFCTAWIGLLEPGTDWVRPVARFGACPDYVGMSQVSIDGSKEAGRGPSGTAIRENRTDYILDLDTDPRSLPWREDMTRCGFKSSMSTPIHRKEQPIGVLTLYSGNKNVFDAEEITLVEEMAQAISLAMQYLDQRDERAKAEAQIHWLAYYDPLTKLPNRVFLVNYLERSITNYSDKTNLAVVFIDLDGFKEVNDSQGHASGDRLLQEVASRLQGILGPEDLVSRFGGDEFVLVLQSQATEDGVLHLLKALQAEVCAPIRIDDASFRISCSAGVTFFHGGEGTAEILLRDADVAMYEAKTKGRGQISSFNRAVVQRREAAKRLRAEVDEALEQGQFCLYYQPQVNMKTGSIVGVEALIRWNHPDRGLLTPGHFLEAIINYPVMNQIGQWVLEEAVAQTARWLSEGLLMTVSINISANQFQDPNFIQLISSVLHQYPEVRPSQLKLELLEDTTFKDNFDLVQQNIEKCNELGLTVSLDDFGTGYSSLTHLQLLAVKEVKIDHTFTRGLLAFPKNIAIVSGLLSTTLPSQLRVIAEGVEDEKTGMLLLKMGCELAQGYFIAKPMPAQEFLKWCVQWTPVASWEQCDPWRIMVSDLPAAVAGLVHQQISELIVQSIHNPSRFPRPVLGAHECEFGQWYASLGKQRYGHLPTFSNIKAVHDKVHELSAEIIRHRNAGDSVSADVKAQELHDRLPIFIAQINAFIGEIDLA